MDNDNNSPTDADLEAHFANYDPLNSPSPVQVVGDVRLPEPSLSGLPTAMRAEIEGKLVGVSPAKRAQEEQRLIAEALRFNSRQVRVMAGYGEGATETQRADAQIANQVRLLKAETDQIKALLDEHRTVTDPLTGEEIATPHKRINGEQRAAYEARLAEIGHHYGRLVGPEGEKLRADAIAKDKANYRAMEEQLSVMKEADARAAELAREAKVDQLAQAKLRFRQSSLG